MKKWPIAAAVLSLCISMVSAQDVEWKAYFRGPYWPEVYPLDSTGQQDAPLWPVVPETWKNTPEKYMQSDVNQFQIAPTGDTMVYSLATGGLDIMYFLEDPYQESIIAYDMAAQAVIIDYELPPFATFVINQGSFDPTTGQFAVLVWQPNSLTDETGAELSREALSNGLTRFEVMVFDPAVGNTPIATLSDQPYLKERYATFGMIHALKDGNVTFSLEDAQGDRPTYETHVWDINTNMVVDDPRYTWRSDVLPATGEAVQAGSSQEYPFSEDVGGPFIYFQSNVVQVWNPADQAWHIFYHDPLRSFSRAHFVQNGERILVGASGEEDGDPSWLLFERDGTLVDEIEVPSSGRPSLSNLTMTPNGFLITTPSCGESGCSSTIIDEYNTRDGLDLKAMHTVATFDGRQDLIWFQPTQSITPDYMDWIFLPPAQP